VLEVGDEGRGGKLIKGTGCELIREIGAPVHRPGLPREGRGGAKITDVDC